MYSSTATPRVGRSRKLFPPTLLAAAIRYCDSAAWKTRFAPKIASIRNDLAEIMGANQVYVRAVKYFGELERCSLIVFGPCPVMEDDVVLNPAENAGGSGYFDARAVRSADTAVEVPALSQGVFAKPPLVDPAAIRARRLLSSGRTLLRVSREYGHGEGAMAVGLTMNDVITPK